MRLSRRSQILLRLGVGVTLAFIYIPLIVIAIYAFNGGNVLEWPPPGSPRLVRRGVRRPRRARRLLTSIKVGLAATAIALVLGTLASLAGRPPPVLRPRDGLVPRHPADRPPGIVTGVALSDTFTQVSGVDSACCTVIVGHATFCIVVVYNNVIARLRRPPAPSRRRRRTSAPTPGRPSATSPCRTCDGAGRRGRCSPSPSRSTRSSSPRFTIGPAKRRCRSGSSHQHRAPPSGAVDAVSPVGSRRWFL